MAKPKAQPKEKDADTATTAPDAATAPVDAQDSDATAAGVTATENAHASIERNRPKPPDMTLDAFKATNDVGEQTKLFRVALRNSYFSAVSVPGMNPGVTVTPMGTTMTEAEVKHLKANTEALAPLTLDNFSIVEVK